jgi:hypothetical protein
VPPSGELNTEIQHRARLSDLRSIVTSINWRLPADIARETSPHFGIIAHFQKRKKPLVRPVIWCHTVCWTSAREVFARNRQNKIQPLGQRRSEFAKILSSRRFWMIVRTRTKMPFPIRSFAVCRMN